MVGNNLVILKPASWFFLWAALLRKVLAALPEQTCIVSGLLESLILAVTPWQIYSQKVDSLICGRHDSIGLNMPLGKTQSAVGWGIWENSNNSAGKRWWWDSLARPLRSQLTASKTVLSKGQRGGGVSGIWSQKILLESSGEALLQNLPLFQWGRAGQVPSCSLSCYLKKWWSL